MVGASVVPCCCWRCCRLWWSTSWKRRSRCNQVCRGMLASARRDWHVGAVANVNGGVVLVIVGLRLRRNYWSVWAGWWVQGEYPASKRSVTGVWVVAKVDLPRARRYPTWKVVIVAGLSEVGSDILRYFDGFSELMREIVTCEVRVPFPGWIWGSVLFIRPMEIKCYFSVKNKFQYIWDDYNLTWYYWQY